MARRSISSSPISWVVENRNRIVRRAGTRPRTAVARIALYARSPAVGAERRRTDANEARSRIFRDHVTGPAVLRLEVGAGHEVGLYPVVYLERTLGLDVGPGPGTAAAVDRRRSLGSAAGGQHVAHQLVGVAADHALPVVHDGPDEPVGLGHEPELEEYGHVVPVHDPGADLVPGERAHELAVPDAIGDGEHEAAAAPELGPQPGAEQELDAGQVDLAQVPRVIHVRQVQVQVGGEARGRVRGRVGDAQPFLEPRGRHVAEQHARKVRQVDGRHGQHERGQRDARHRQRRYRPRAAAVRRRRGHWISVGFQRAAHVQQQHKTTD